MPEPFGLSPSVEWWVNEVKFPAVIWQRYADAIGHDTMKKIYGDHWPPPECRPLERVFSFRDPAVLTRAFDPTDHPAAWLSLAFDQFDQKHAYMARGVWPMEHGQGLGRFMRTWAEDWCRRNEVEAVSIWVSDANIEHLNNVEKDTEYWEPTGKHYDPPSYMFTHYLDV